MNRPFPRAVVLLVAGTLVLALVLWLGQGTPPIVLRPFARASSEDNHATMMISNTTSRVIHWLPILEEADEKTGAWQPRQLSGVTAWRSLPANRASYFTTKVPDLKKRWRVRCVLLRDPRPWTKPLDALLNRVLPARRTWVVTSDELVAEKFGGENPGARITRRRQRRSRSSRMRTKISAPRVGRAARPQSFPHPPRGRAEECHRPHQHAVG